MADASDIEQSLQEAQRQITQQEEIIGALERDGLDASAARELLIELQEHFAAALKKREAAQQGMAQEVKGGI